MVRLQSHASATLVTCSGARAVRRRGERAELLDTAWRGERFGSPARSTRLDAVAGEIHEALRVPSRAPMTIGPRPRRAEAMRGRRISPKNCARPPARAACAAVREDLVDGVRTRTPVELSSHDPRMGFDLLELAMTFTDVEDRDILRRGHPSPSRPDRDELRERELHVRPVPAAGRRSGSRGSPRPRREELRSRRCTIGPRHTTASPVDDEAS